MQSASAIITACSGAMSCGGKVGARARASLADTCMSQCCVCTDSKGDGRCTSPCTTAGEMPSAILNVLCRQRYLVVLKSDYALAETLGVYVQVQLFSFGEGLSVHIRECSLADGLGARVWAIAHCLARSDSLLAGQHSLPAMPAS